MPVPAPTDVDSTQQLISSAPTFGTLLRSIGTAVAESQSALDKSMVENVQALSDTKITVVTDVITRLDDDGMPVPPPDDPNLRKQDLITTDVSVLNYFMPTMHEWRRVALSMDLTVARFSSQDAFTFERKQGGTSRSTGFWGFLNWFGGSNSGSTEVTNSSSNVTQRETDFTQGEVRMDALLAPRRTQAFKAPINVSKGPQIFVAQGETRDTKAEGKVIGRETDLLVHVIKPDGGDNPGKNLKVDANGLLVTFAAGSTTDATGRLTMTAKRSFPSALYGTPKSFTLTLTLGGVRQPVTITL